MSTKLVKVGSLDMAIELYRAGLLLWYDGEAWTLDNGYAEPAEYCSTYCYISVEE